MRAREEARTARRTSVAIDTSGGARGLRGSRAGGGGGLVAASGKPKVEKSQGGKKIWMRAKMAAGVRR